MVNFIIYEKQADFREEYEIAILNFLGCREEKFKMFDYDNFVELLVILEKMTGLVK